MVASGFEPSQREYRDIGSGMRKSASTVLKCDWPNPSEEIALDPMQNRVLTQDMFDSLCEYLIIDNLNISDIEDAAFASMPQLNMLIIENNNLGTVRRAMFNGISSNLRELRLVNDRIGSIEVRAFTQIENLAFLDLSHNPIAGAVTPQTFVITNPGPFQLKLSNTGIAMEPGLFQHVPYLSLLYLNGNPFRYVPNMWQGLELIQLELQNASITELRKQMFEGLEGSLWDLYLDNNNINTNSIEPGVFEEMKSLWRLGLSNCGLTEVKDKMWDGIRANLGTLNLAGNSFQTIQPYSFTGFDNLQYLDLSGCGIERIDNLAFQGVGSQQSFCTVNLENNPISSISENLFSEGIWDDRYTISLGPKILCETERCWMQEKVKANQISFYEGTRCSNLDMSVMAYFENDCA